MKYLIVLCFSKHPRSSLECFHVNVKAAIAVIEKQVFKSKKIIKFKLVNKFPRGIMNKSQKEKE